MRVPLGFGVKAEGCGFPQGYEGSGRVGGSGVPFRGESSCSGLRTKSLAIAVTHSAGVPRRHWMLRALGAPTCVTVCLQIYVSAQGSQCRATQEGRISKPSTQHA